MNGLSYTTIIAFADSLARLRGYIGGLFASRPAV